MRLCRSAAPAQRRHTYVHLTAVIRRRPLGCSPGQLPPLYQHQQPKQRLCTQAKRQRQRQEKKNQRRVNLADLPDMPVHQVYPAAVSEGSRLLSTCCKHGSLCAALHCPALERSGAQTPGLPAARCSQHRTMCTHDPAMAHPLAPTRCMTPSMQRTQPHCGIQAMPGRQQRCPRRPGWRQTRTRRPCSTTQACCRRSGPSRRAPACSTTCGRALRTPRRAAAALRRAPARSHPGAPACLRAPCAADA